MTRLDDRCMPAIPQIEASIETLPAQDFFTLLGWMAERHLKVLGSPEYEAAELEEAMDAALDSPRHPLNDEFFAGLRSTVQQSPQ